MNSVFYDPEMIFNIKYATIYVTVYTLESKMAGLHINIIMYHSEENCASSKSMAGQKMKKNPTNDGCVELPFLPAVDVSDLNTKMLPFVSSSGDVKMRNYGNCWSCCFFPHQMKTRTVNYFIWRKQPVTNQPKNSSMLKVLKTYTS